MISSMKKKSGKRRVFQVHPSKKIQNFEEIESIEEIELSLRRAKELGSRCVFWTKDQKLISHGRVKASDQMLQIVLPGLPSQTPPEEFEALEHSTPCFVMVFLPQQSVLGFECSFLSHGLAISDSSQSRTLQVTLPKRAYRIQRRKHQRFTIPGGYDIRARLSLSDQAYSFRIFDLSSGGLSLLVPEEEAPLFKKNQFLHGISFSFRFHPFLLSGRVMDIRSLHPSSPGLTSLEQQKKWRKVGIEFKGLSTADDEKISIYVLENLIQFSGQMV